MLDINRMQKHLDITRKLGLALMDGWLDAGVNILMPCEVDAGMDILMLQERYGDRCGFHGGIQ